MQRKETGILRELVPMGLWLLLLWFVFTGKTDPAELVLGVLAASLFTLLSYKLLRGGLDPAITGVVIIKLPLYALLLFWEILKANLDVLRRVFSPRIPISPRIVSFETFLGTDMARTVLANSITLTPGTLTVDVAGSCFKVHCLAPEHQDSLLEGRLERMVAWLFSDGPPESRRLR